MNNGQGNGDTESGAYTLVGGTPTPSNPAAITRQAGATVFLPSNNEWYKAAYYNPVNNSYFQYPTSSNSVPVASSPTPLPNHANFFNGGPGQLTDVGAYSGTLSPYGAFDMGGNVWQWDEAFIGSGTNTQRGIWGASWGNNASNSKSGGQTFFFPEGQAADGFRLASVPGVPEPSTLALAAFGFAGMTAWRWRRKRFSARRK
jgi:sulfatase modifying factor 1